MGVLNRPSNFSRHDTKFQQALSTSHLAQYHAKLKFTHFYSCDTMSGASLRFRNCSAPPLYTNLPYLILTVHTESAAAADVGANRAQFTALQCSTNIHISRRLYIVCAALRRRTKCLVGPSVRFKPMCMLFGSIITVVVRSVCRISFGWIAVSLGRVYPGCSPRE